MNFPSSTNSIDMETDTSQMIKQYFSLLRKEKGHNPEASPMDLELLLMVRYISISSADPIQVLKKNGIILSGNKIAINGNLLHVILESSRSRINNTLKRIGWNTIQLCNKDKQMLLQSVLNKNDCRNWTFREIPEGRFLEFVRNNPQIQISDNSTAEPVVSTYESNMPLDSNESLSNLPSIIDGNGLVTRDSVLF